MSAALERLQALTKELVGSFELYAYNPDLSEFGNECAEIDAHEAYVKTIIQRTVKIVEEDAKWILDSAAAITEKREEPRPRESYLSEQYFNAVNN